MRYAKENHEENVHTHHDDVMADARPDLQPAAVVTHQEKKVLKGKRLSVIMTLKFTMYCNYLITQSFVILKI